MNAATKKDDLLDRIEPTGPLNDAPLEPGAKAKPGADDLSAAPSPFLQSVNRVRSTMKKVGDSAANLPDDKVRPVSNLLSGLMRILRAIAMKLGFLKTAEKLDEAANQASNAKTGQQLAESAKMAGESVDDMAAAIAPLDKHQKDVKMLNDSMLVAGLDKIEAALFSTISFANGEAAGDAEKLIPAAMNGYADAIDFFRGRNAQLEREIRHAFESVPTRNAKIDIKSLSMQQLEDLSATTDLLDKEAIKAAFVEFNKNSLSSATLIEKSNEVFEGAWKSHVQLSDIHVPIHRIWTSDQIQTNLDSLEKQYPSIAADREKFQARAVANLQAAAEGVKPEAPQSSEGALDSAPIKGTVPEATVPAPQRSSSDLIAAIDIDAPESTPVKPVDMSNLTPEQAQFVKESAQAVSNVQDYRMKVSGFSSLSELAASDAQKVTASQSTPAFQEAQKMVADQNAAKAERMAASRDPNGLRARLLSAGARLEAAAAGAGLSSVSEDSNVDSHQMDNAPVPA